MPFIASIPKPPTQYVKSGSINIAYQVFGEGKIDLVYIPGWVSNIDWMWLCPELVDFLTKLGQVARIILFDKRGTGLSDRIVELSTLEERMDDIRAVMDAVDSKKAILFGHSEGGSVSALFAATYPNRTLALIAFGIFAKRRSAPDYPWAPTDEERQVVYDMIENSWGSGEMNLTDLAPSKANDAAFMDWLANYFRSGASPSAALVLTKMNTQVDIIDVLPSINVPTLLMQRKHDIDVKIEEGRFIAERIKGATFVEFEGSDHLFWAGNTQEVLDEMMNFIETLRPTQQRKEQLLTIVVASIHSNRAISRRSSLISINEEQLRQQFIQKYRGTIRAVENNTYVLTFEGSSKAIHCCFDVFNAIQALNMQLTIGIHLGECLIINDKLVETYAVKVAEVVHQQASIGQILATQPIAHLLPTEAFQFSPISKTYSKQLIPPLFVVEDPYLETVSEFTQRDNLTHKHGFLLDNVMQCIQDNLDNEAFSIEDLCQQTGLSERQLQRKLKAITNKSPNQLIRSVRLHRAKELLLNQSDSIADIAFQTGFSTPSYFSKCFKKEFGMSPSDLL
ncbi:MAG: alpha/beta fold hydrolase [Bacteroidota bacterium]